MSTKIGPSPHSYFTDEVVAVLRSIDDVTNVKAVPGVFAVDLVFGTSPRRVYLENHYAETRDLSPDQRRAHLLRALTQDPTSDVDEPWHVARERLVPVLRGTTYGLLPKSALPEGASGTTTTLLRRSFVPFVDVFVVLDSDTTMQFVTRERCDQWKVTPDEVFAAAFERLATASKREATWFQRLTSRSKREVTLYDRTHGPLWRVTTDDSYETSRLLQPGWLASFRDKVEGTPVAIMPDRATLLVGGDARPDLVERLLSTAERELEASTRNLSYVLYTLDENDRVVPWSGDGSNPDLARAARVAQHKLASAEYTYQKKVLDEDPAVCNDWFVSNHKIFGTPDGAVVSTAAWTRTVPTLLPKTDVIALVVLDEADEAAPPRVVEVPWSAVEARLTERPGTYPPRFETLEFPSDAELDALERQHRA